jgi:flagellar basal-body rod protein FlgC
MLRSAEGRRNHDLALGVYRKTMTSFAPASAAAGREFPTMNEMTKTLQAAASGMAAQRPPAPVHRNIANADTPGYRRKLVSFEETLRPATRGRWRRGRSSSTGRPSSRIHDPNHPLAGPDGYYDGSNVDLMVEIADAREASRSYEANLRMFDQARRWRVAARPAPPLELRRKESRIRMDIKSTLAAQVYTRALTAAKPEPTGAAPAEAFGARRRTSSRRCGRARRR